VHGLVLAAHKDLLVAGVLADELREQGETEAVRPPTVRAAPGAALTLTQIPPGSAAGEGSADEVGDLFGVRQHD
jgi:hypothetical protein